MISIVTPPETVVLSKNPIGFLVLSDIYVSQEGGIPYIQFEKVSTPIETQEFTFPVVVRIINGVEYYSFQFGAATDNPVILPITDDLDDIADAFRANYAISSNYNIEVSGNFINFIYKDTPPSEFYPADIAQPSSFTVNAKSAGSERLYNNYSVFCILMFEDDYLSGDYDEYELLFDFNTSAQSLIQINDLINSIFTGYDLPDYAETDITICQDTIKRFYIRMSEYDNDNQTPLKLYDSDLFYVLKGKTSFLDSATSLSDFCVTGQNWLYSGPTSKNITTDTHEYLYYLSFNNYNIYTKFVAYYSDGTTETAYTDEFVILQYQAAIIPVGYRVLLPLISPAGKVVYKYIVSIVRKVGAAYFTLAKEIIYNIKNSLPEDQEFLFMNEFGVFENIIAQGINKRSINIEGEINKRFLEVGYTINEGEFFSSDKTSYNSFSSYTGFKSREEAAHLELLLRSNKFFYIDKDNERYIPCIMTSSSIETVDNSDYIFSLNFEYRFAFDN